MANVQHVDLTDPYVHEPKGITTASANTVYVCDGASTGDWTQITPNNHVQVHSASDLPTASGGVRTLAADTTYHITGAVDIGGDRLVMSDGTTIMGHNNLYDTITSTTTGALITMTDVNTRITNVGFVCSSGSFFDVDGTGVESCTLDYVSVTCDTIGDVDNIDEFDVSRCVFTAASAGMTTTGAIGEFHINDSHMTVTATNGTVIDLGTATFDKLLLRDIEFANPTGTGYGVDIAAAGANLNSGKFGFIAGCTFTNPSVSTNYTEGDNQWLKIGTPAMPPTIAKAQGYVDNNANANSFGGGVGVDEAVNFGTSFVADIEDKFTISTAGRFTYTGVADTVVSVHGSARVTMGGGSARVRNLKIAKNGTVIESSVSSKELSGSAEGTYAINSIVSLTTNDYIELYIEPETATTATTVDTCSIMILEVQQ